MKDKEKCAFIINAKATDFQPFAPSTTVRCSFARELSESREGKSPLPPPSEDALVSKCGRICCHLAVSLKSFLSIAHRLIFMLSGGGVRLKSFRGLILDPGATSRANRGTYLGFQDMA